MEITTQVSLKDYRNWMIRSTARRPIPWVIMLVGLLWIFAGLFVESEKGGSNIFSGFVLLIMFPGIILLRSNQAYKSSPTIGEKTNYQFLDDKLLIRGESFESSFSWDRLYQVKVEGNSLAIYQSKQLASLIPLRDVWEGDLLKLKEILDSNKVKNNLKAG